MRSAQPAPNPEERPSNARMYDYFLGGFHNFAIDRTAAERILTVEPDFALILRANRAFLRRAVLFVASAGVRQFLDLGAGIPTVGSVHEVARAMDAASRVVYIDIDPIATALSQDILTGNAHAVAIQADATQPDQVLRHPYLSQMLDLRQPVAVLLVAFLHLVSDDDAALRIVRHFRDSIASGSYLVISHATDRFGPERSARTANEFNRASPASQVTLRSREQVLQFFEGFELVEPGVVPTPSWRPDSADDLFVNEPERAQAFAGVGLKP
ncbi:MAG: SAM-dependent methyltransferase [Chloroflexi bacterium]|nr:SAM-dependent methyltransferase [Chloroflexota bacterium]